MRHIRFHLRKGSNKFIDVLRTRIFVYKHFVNVENNRTAMSLRILAYYARLVGCSSDSLVGDLEPEYTETALDRELYQAILKLDTETKEKLLKTIDLWTKK